MKLTKRQREIIKQDIIDLKNLANMYASQNKFEKASNCLKEMQELKAKLEGNEA